jgi:hypothetical protein
LFHARARDVDTGSVRTDANCRSEIYFIEIRPYRQYWHIMPGGGQSMMPGPTPEDLITILEYTRAVLKKTWAITQRSMPPEAQRELIDGLSADVQYCARALADIRDDPDHNFGDAQKAAIDTIIAYYERADSYLTARAPEAALPAEREAYRRLRRFTDELHLNWSPPSSGQSVPEDKPERIRLQEEVETPPGEDNRRAEEQLEQIHQQIEAISEEQKRIKTALSEAMKQQQQAASEAQSSQSSSAGSPSQGQPSPGASAGQGQSPGQPPQGQKAASASQSQDARQTAPGRQATSETTEHDDSAAAEGQTAGRDEATPSGSQGRQAARDGARQGASSSQTSGQPTVSNAEGTQPSRLSSDGRTASSQSEASASGQGPSGNTPSQDQGSWTSSAPTEARLRMLQARQRALGQQAAEVSEDLQQLAATEQSGSENTKAADQAQQHVDQAVADMQELEERLAEMRYEPVTSSDEQAQMAQLADSAAQKLTEAGQAIQRSVSSGKGRSAKEQAARDMAEKLTQDAEALAESLSPAEREQMVRQLEAAKRLLESMAGPQWTTITGGGGSGSAHVYTRSEQMAPDETARLLAQQFWSIALEAQDRRLTQTEDEPSDAQFYDLEIKFFESAARFDPQHNEQ